MAPATCDACGKGGHKLLRCGRCRGVWFCNRECQVLAARQGHSGANCRPTGGARTITAVGAEVAPRVPDAAVPSTTAVDPASMAPAANACHACGKSHAKLLRCGRCRGVWFCNRECQVVAARQGHSGVNCRPAGVRTITAADAEVAPRVPDAAGPSTTAPGVDSASLAPAACSCHACANSGGRLLRCGRCWGVWFCNRECQVAAARQGHSGVNCRPADGLQRPQPLAHARSPFAAPSQPSTAMDSEQLKQRSRDLLDEAYQAQQANTRIGYLTAVEKVRESASVADLVGGAKGATCRAATDLLQSSCLLRLGNTAAAARAACSSLRAARSSGNRSSLISALSICSNVAMQAPDEMVKAERESREQERLGGSPSYGGLDLSQEGWVSLPTTPAALSRLGLAYNEAAVATCDAALTAAGGGDSPAADDERRVPSLVLEAHIRGFLGTSLHDLDERQCGSELLWQAVALLRPGVRKAAPGFDLRGAKQGLVAFLYKLGSVWDAGSDGAAEAEACLREALALCEEIDLAGLKQNVLLTLCNMSGRPDLPVGPAEAAALRSRLNALYAQAGRSTDTSCTICLEPLEMPGGDAENGAADDSGRDADGYINSAVRVLGCGHQFHRGCLSTWWRTRSERRSLFARCDHLRVPEGAVEASQRPRRVGAAVPRRLAHLVEGSVCVCRWALGPRCPSAVSKRERERERRQ